MEDESEFDPAWALLLAVILILLWLSGAMGAEPVFTVENKKAPGFTVENKARETFRSSDGYLYEKHADGFYRRVPGQSAPEVAQQTFRPSSIYNPTHNCPTCGRSQYVVDSFNRDGTHNHRCPADGTVWRH